MKACLVIIAYNSDNELKKFLDSICHLDLQHSIDIYILDNFCSNNTKLLVEQHISDAIYLNPGKNLGYSGGFNHVFANLKKNYDIYIQSNSDIIIKDKAFFKRIFNCALNDEFDIYAPRIISTLTNNDQNPYMLKKPSIFWIIKIWLLNNVKLIFLINSKIKKIKNGIGSKLKKYIFAPHGSFIVYRNSFFKHISMLESRNFLYYEEEILGLLCEKYSMRVMFDNENKLFHNEHISTSEINTDKKLKIKRHSFNILLKHYFNE